MAQGKSFTSRIPMFAVIGAAGMLLGYLIFFRGGKTEAATESKPEPQVPVAEADAAAPNAGVATPAILPAPPTRVEARQEPPGRATADNGWRALADSGKLYEARKAVAELFLSTTDDVQRGDLADQAIALNRKLLISKPDDRDIEYITLAHGENPTSFARRVKSLHGEPGLMFMLNGLKPKDPIRAGAQLRVTKKDAWTLYVDKSMCRMWICYDGAPFKGYTVCVGADDRTPATKWLVGEKNPKPAWTAPNDWLEQEHMKNPILYGNPKNPLGEYWLGIEAPGWHGFGIHGTNQPETMGQKKSQGCVRMLNNEVVELAGCVWKGMEVVTVE